MSFWRLEEVLLFNGRAIWRYHVLHMRTIQSRHSKPHLLIRQNPLSKALSPCRPREPRALSGVAGEPEASFQRVSSELESEFQGICRALQGNTRQTPDNIKVPPSFPGDRHLKAWTKKLPRYRSAGELDSTIGRLSYEWRLRVGGAWLW